MATTLPQIEDLPRRAASEVKNRWGELLHTVRSGGAVAVTSHDKVEVVVIEARKYREMTRLVEGAEARRRDALADLSAEYDQHLESLKAPDAPQRIAAAMASKGRVRRRAKAGPSY